MVVTMAAAAAEEAAMVVTMAAVAVAVAAAAVVVIPVEATDATPVAVVLSEIMDAVRINNRKTRSGWCASGFTLIEMLVALAVLAVLVALLGQVVNQVSETITRATEHTQSDTEAEVIFDRIGDDIAQIINRTDVDSLFVGMSTNSGGSDNNDQMFFYSQGAGFSTNGSNPSPVTLISYLVTNQALVRLGVARSWDDIPFITPSNGITEFSGSTPLSNVGNPTNYFHVIGPSVFRMEVALLMEPDSINPDGSTNGINTYANIGSGTNSWHGLTNVSSIVVALGILDQTSRKIMTPQQLSNVAAALPDSMTNGGVPIGNWSTNAYSVPNIPPAALSQVRVYQRSFPVKR